MKTFLFFLFTAVNVIAFAQFSTESQVVTYMSAKEFYSDSYQMTVSYEFIPRYNTYGIVCVNKNNEKFYYINCSVRPYGSSADINGMSSDGGGNFGFRLYEGRLSVQGEMFYLKQKSNYQAQDNSTLKNSGDAPLNGTYKIYQTDFRGSKVVGKFENGKIYFVSDGKPDRLCGKIVNNKIYWTEIDEKTGLEVPAIQSGKIEGNIVYITDEYGNVKRKVAKVENGQIIQVGDADAGYPMADLTIGKYEGNSLCGAAGAYIIIGF